MKGFHIPLLGALVLLLFLGLTFAQLEDLQNPKAQPQIDKLRLVDICFTKNTLNAVAAVGYVEGFDFIPVAKFEEEWKKAQVLATLTAEEKAALVSIRAKVRAAIIANYEAQP